MIEFADTVSAQQSIPEATQSTNVSAPQPTVLTSSINTSTSSISVVDQPSSSSRSSEQPNESTSNQAVPQAPFLSLPSTSREDYEGNLYNFS